MERRIRNTISFLAMALFTASMNVACAGISKRVVAPTDSFTLLSANHIVEICASQQTQEDPDFQTSGLPVCASFESKSLASGTIIRHYREPSNNEERSLVLSVAHWCQPPTGGEVLQMVPPGGPREMVMAGIYTINRHATIEYAVDNLGIQHHVTRKVSIDNSVDVCLIEVERIEMPALRIAQSNPRHGDRVLNMAAPWGFFNPPNIFIDEGLYLGECRDPEICRIVGEFNISGIYAGQGSSGSPILIRRGGQWQIAGIIHAVRVAPFGGAYLPMGATVEQINHVIRRDFIPYLENQGQSDPKESDMK